MTRSASLSASVTGVRSDLVSTVKLPASKRARVRLSTLLAIVCARCRSSRQRRCLAGGAVGAGAPLPVRAPRAVPERLGAVGGESRSWHHGNGGVGSVRLHRRRARHPAGRPACAEPLPRREIPGGVRGMVEVWGSDGLFPVILRKNGVGHRADRCLRFGGLLLVRYADEYDPTREAQCSIMPVLPGMTLSQRPSRSVWTGSRWVRWRVARGECG